MTAGDDGAVIRVWVVPGASRSEITGRYGDRIKVRVSAPPEAGLANKEVSRLLAERLGAPVELRSGTTGREKVFLARGVDAGDARAKLTR